MSASAWIFLRAHLGQANENPSGNFGSLKNRISAPQCEQVTAAFGLFSTISDSTINHWGGIKHHRDDPQLPQKPICLMPFQYFSRCAVAAGSNQGCRWCSAHCALQASSAVKDIRKFQDYSIGVTLDLISYKGILSGMVALLKRTRQMARQDFKQDHWLLRVAFGLCLVALAIWLVVLYGGYVIVA
jgi:hypothetical protein